MFATFKNFAQGFWEMFHETYVEIVNAKTVWDEESDSDAEDDINVKDVDDDVQEEDESDSDSEEFIEEDSSNLIPDFRNGLSL